MLSYIGDAVQWFWQAYRSHCLGAYFTDNDVNLTTLVKSHGDATFCPYACIKKTISKQPSSLICHEHRSAKHNNEQTFLRQTASCRVYLSNSSEWENAAHWLRSLYVADSITPISKYYAHNDTDRNFPRHLHILHDLWCKTCKWCGKFLGVIKVRSPGNEKKNTETIKNHVLDQEKPMMTMESWYDRRWWNHEIAVGISWSLQNKLILQVTCSSIFYTKGTCTSDSMFKINFRCQWNDFPPGLEFIAQHSQFHHTSHIMPIQAFQNSRG